MMNKIRLIIVVFYALLITACSEPGGGTATIINSASSATIVKLSDYTDESHLVTMSPGEEILYPYITRCFVLLPDTEKRKMVYQDGSTYTIKDKVIKQKEIYFTNTTETEQILINTLDEITGDISVPPVSNENPEYRNYPITLVWVLGLDLQIKPGSDNQAVIESKIENEKQYFLIRNPGW